MSALRRLRHRYRGCRYFTVLIVASTVVSWAAGHVAFSIGAPNNAIYVIRLVVFFALLALVGFFNNDSGLARPKLPQFLAMCATGVALVSGNEWLRGRSWPLSASLPVAALLLGIYVLTWLEVDRRWLRRHQQSQAQAVTTGTGPRPRHSKFR